MVRKKSWFGWVRRLSVSEQKPKAEKVFLLIPFFLFLELGILHFFLVNFACLILTISEIKEVGMVLGGLKVKQCLALSAPQRTVSEASETQKKYALTVALATAAAAEVARLTIASHPSHHVTKGVKLSLPLKYRTISVHIL